MQTRRRFLAAALATGLVPAVGLAGETVTVFAAASLANALGEIGDAFEAATGHTVTASLAGTATLARQIDRGAPADIVIAANRDWMDWLAARGRIDTRSRVDLLGNRLVLVAHDANAAAVTIDRTLNLRAMLGAGRLAMALVDAVPAGLYGKAALQHLGLWQSLAPMVAQTDNVRVALALVASGTAPLGIVYASDAMAEPRVKMIGTFPENSHPPITYPAAQVEGNRTAAAVDFLVFLQGPIASAAFTRQGFRPLGAP